ncbi:MAG: DUF4124 domain-containing protein, partial [Rhodoferax sp.]
DERIAQARADNCARARQAKASLESGLRINQVNTKGERVFMGDTERAAELQRIEAAIASDCN